jgi:hypothetical protein
MGLTVSDCAVRAEGRTLAHGSKGLREREHRAPAVHVITRRAVDHPIMIELGDDLSGLGCHGLCLSLSLCLPCLRLGYRQGPTVYIPRGVL